MNLCIKHPALSATDNYAGKYGDKGSSLSVSDSFYRQAKIQNTIYQSGINQVSQSYDLQEFFKE